METDTGEEEAVGIGIVIAVVVLFFGTVLATAALLWRSAMPRRGRER